jgi:hypothetical protein
MPILEKLTSSFLQLRSDQADASRVAAQPLERKEGTGVFPFEMEHLVVAKETTAGRLCGAQGCTSGWMKPWKSRRRPVFEQEWGCSTRCLTEMVSAAVLREMGEGIETLAEEPHRHRVPLGLVLLAQGWITQPQLQSALAAQRANGEGRIGDWLAKGCGLPEDRIARGLGVQWNCPVLSLQGFSPRQMALAMPKRFLAEFGLVPVRVAASTILYMAFQEKLKPSVALGIEQMCRLKVESGLLTETQLESARTRLMAADSVPVRIRSMGDADEMTRAIVKLLEHRQPVMTRFVRVEQYYWLRLWMEDAAVPPPGGLQITTEDTEDHVFLMD